MKIDLYAGLLHSHAHIDIEEKLQPRYQLKKDYQKHSDFFTKKVIYFFNY